MAMSYTQQNRVRITIAEPSATGTITQNYGPTATIIAQGTNAYDIVRPEPQNSDMGFTITFSNGSPSETIVIKPLISGTGGGSRLIFMGGDSSDLANWQAYSGG